MSASTTTDTKTRSERDMASTVRHRRGPRYRQTVELPPDPTASIRELRAHTEGLTNRLPLASLEGMRAGNVAGPQQLARRYLYAGWRYGLDRAWAQRFAVWVQNQVDALWPTSNERTEVLRRRALAAEGRGNEAELATLDDQMSPAARDAEIDALRAEIAEDQTYLARRIREREAMA